MILFPWKVDDFLLKRKGKVVLFFVRYDPFFLLDSQVVLIFCPKKCLTTLRVVMRLTYTRPSLERSFRCLFKDNNRLGETISRRYMPYLIGDVCLDLTCK